MKLLMFILFFLSFSVFLSAEELALTDYLSMVEKKSISLQIKNIESDSRKYDTYQAYSTFLPKANINVNYIYSELIEDNEKNQLYAQSDLRNPYWSRSFDVYFPIFLGGSRYLRAKIAEKNEELGLVDLEYEKMRIKAEGVASFIAAFVASETLIVAEKGKSLAEENLRYGEVLKNSGRVTELAFLNFQLSFETRNQDVILSQNEIIKSFSKMSQIAASEIAPQTLLINKDVDKIVEKFSSCEKDCYSEYEKSAIKSSPLIRKIRGMESISDDALWLSGTPFLPTAAFTYKHDFGSAKTPFGDTFAEDYDLSRYKNNLYILSFSWNLFNGFADTISYKKAKAQDVSAKLLVVETENQIKSGIKTIISSIISYIAQRKTAKLAQKISEETLRKTKIEFDSGKVTYLDLLNAETAFLSAKKTALLVDGAILNSYYQMALLLGKNILD